MNSAVRSPDPYQRIWKSWLLRRLSPDSNPIKMEELSGKRDEHILLQAMGSEAANVHLGTPHQANLILRGLNSTKIDWLHSAARQMGKSTIREWKYYCA